MSSHRGRSSVSKKFKKSKTRDRLAGKLGHLDPEERQVLEVFQNTVAKEHAPECEIRCLQFLRARNFELNEALKMYGEDMEWRTTNKVDGILSEKLNREKEIAELWPVSFSGYDRFGRPVLIDRTGLMDIGNLVEKKKIPMNVLLRYHIKQQEYLKSLMMEASARFNRPVDSLLIVMDIGEATLKRHLNKNARELFQAVAQIDEAHYPETIGRLILINSPSALTFAWNFIKSFLNPHTRAKIEFYAPGKPLTKTQMQNSMTKRRTFYLRSTSKRTGSGPGGKVTEDDVVRVPKMTEAQLATIEELKLHEMQGPRTSSWRVRLSELIPQECLCEYLGIRGTAPDPGLLVDLDGTTLCPTVREPFETLHFDTPLPAGVRCPAWYPPGTVCQTMETLVTPEYPTIPEEDEFNAEDTEAPAKTTNEALQAQVPVTLEECDVFMTARDFGDKIDSMIENEAVDPAVVEGLWMGGSKAYGKNSEANGGGSPDQQSKTIEHKLKKAFTKPHKVVKKHVQRTVDGIKTGGDKMVDGIKTGGDKMVNAFKEAGGKAQDSFRGSASSSRAQSQRGSSSGSQKAPDVETG